MNGTLTRPRAKNRSISSFSYTAATPASRDFFATTPMQAIWREPDWQCEEETYTSFEAAISNRVLALKERHISANVSTDMHRGASPTMDRLVHRAFTFCHNVCSRRIWKRGILLFGAALMFMLIGFDLMGLLVLSVR